ncbi:MAG: hypothetical protein RXN91_04095 [Caldivirga sp.]
MEPTEVAKALILGKFAKPLTEGLYSYKRLDEIKNYLARDLRVVSREAQQRFVVVIGPGLGLDATSTNVFGTLTPTIDDVLNYTLKVGYALQVGFNYGLVSSEWRKSAKSLYSSSLYALEKVIIEVEGKDTTHLDDARKAARKLVDGLLSYVDDVYVEYSGHKSYYLGLWLPEPITGIKAGVNISLSDLYRGLGLRLVKGLGKRERNLIDRQYINAVKLLRVPGYPHEATGKPAQFLDVDLKPAEFDPGIMDRAVLSRGFITSVVSSIALAIEDRRPRRRVRRVKLGKLEEWNLVIKYMLEEEIRVSDGRIRFSYVLGNWCAARRMSLDKCREIHSRLVENANTREYQRYLEYGYQHPEYLPWPFTFFRGHEWYSVTDVDVFQDVFKALRGRVTKHVEAKHAPRSEVEPKQGGGEVKAEASPKPKPEARVEANTPNSNASTGEAEAGPGAKASGAEAREPAVEPNATEPKSSSPEPKIEPNQGSQAGPAAGAHWSGGKATINIGAYVNHRDAPVEAIAIRKSTVGTEAVEAPVRLATVDAVARGLCKAEECLISARLAVIFTLNAVRSGPVRLRWLEGEFKSRHPTHYEALRESGISILDIVAALKGLGVVVIGDVVVPGGWHPRWLATLITRVLEDKGGVTASGLAVLIRKRERDLPSEFEGGLTLSDLVALTVRFLEWLGAVKVEGGFITLVNNK